MSLDTALFAAADLRTPLGREVSDTEAEHAERIVWGWLKGPLGLTERPTTVPDEVWSWATQLGAIYLANPTGLSSRQLGTSMRSFSSERREEILTEAAGGTTESSARPRGSFPPARCYPDPAW